MTYTYEITDEYKKRLGKTLREVRKEKEMTVEEACVCARTQEEICSVSQLRSYESGRVMPDMDILRKLVRGMWMNSVDFLERVANYDMFHFERDFEEIWDLSFLRQFNKASTLLEKLKTKPYCKRENKQVQQVLLLCEALFAKNIDADLPKANKLLCDAINITKPTVLKASSEVDYKYVSTNVLKLNEYRILKLMALVIGIHKSYDESSLILESLEKSLLQKKVNDKIRDRLLPTVYYNLSDALIDCKNPKSYEKALLISETGIKYCRKHDCFKILPYLLFSKGEALFNLGRTEAVVYFKQSYDALK